MMGKQDGLVIALVVLASFGGGVVSNRIFVAPPEVEAQGTPKERLKTAPPVQSAPSAPPQILQVARPAQINVPTAGLVFKAADGRILASIYADQKGGHLDMFNNAGVAVARISAGGDAQVNGGQFTVFNNGRVAVARISAGGDPQTNGGQFTALNEQGIAVAKLSAFLSTGALQVTNGKGEFRGEMRGGRGGGESFLNDDQGPVVRLVTGNGGGNLSLSHNPRSPHTIMVVDGPMNRTTQMKWKAP